MKKRFAYLRNLFAQIYIIPFKPLPCPTASTLHKRDTRKHRLRQRCKYLAKRMLRNTLQPKHRLVMLLVMARQSYLKMT